MFFLKDLLCHSNTLDLERVSSPYASHDILKVLVALFFNFKRDLMFNHYQFFFLTKHGHSKMEHGLACDWGKVHQ